MVEEAEPTEPKTDSSITSGIDARKLLGDKVIIGVPVKTLEEVLAVRQIFEIDYVSVKVNASKKTCPKNDQLWGMDGLRTVRALLPHRIVAIGGLNLESASSVYRDLYFDDGIAMAGGIMDAQDPRATAERICLSLKRVRGAR
jgi:thiamine monophosphate synthase